jgi:hypothetical protein
MSRRRRKLDPLPEPKPPSGRLNGLGTRERVAVPVGAGGRTERARPKVAIDQLTKVAIGENALAITNGYRSKGPNRGPFFFLRKNKEVYIHSNLN